MNEWIQAHTWTVKVCTGRFDWGVGELWVEGAVVSPTGTPFPGRHRLAAWPLLDSFQS